MRVLTRHTEHARANLVAGARTHGCRQQAEKGIVHTHVYYLRRLTTCACCIQVTYQPTINLYCVDRDWSFGEAHTPV